MTDPSQYLFWITTRAAGTTAMILASASVGLGLAMGTRLIKGPDRYHLHQTFALATILAIGVHGLSLLADSYLHSTILDVIVPFVFSYKTLATSIGIVAAWGFVILAGSYYLRRRIGFQRWKLLHRFTLLAWAFGLIHTFTEGTDSGQLWFIALILLTAAPALLLLAGRFLGIRRSPLVAAPAARR